MTIANVGNVTVLAVGVHLPIGAIEMLVCCGFVLDALFDKTCKNEHQKWCWNPLSLICMTFCGHACAIHCGKQCFEHDNVAMTISEGANVTA